MNEASLMHIRKSAFKSVKVGDKVVCFDQYSHDYVEHTLLIESTEYSEEEGLVAYGKDLSYPEEEGCDNYIERVDDSTFVRFAI